jgi:hypothetical protein
MTLKLISAKQNMLAASIGNASENLALAMQSQVAMTLLVNTPFAPWIPPPLLLTPALTHL